MARDIGGQRNRIVRRRDLIALTGTVVLAATVLRPDPGSSQTGSRLPLVAVLWPGRIEVEGDFDAGMRAGLRDGGFVEGTNFAFATRYADGDFSRLGPLAAELVALKPRLAIAAPVPAMLALRRADTNMPIVGAMPADPVAAGLAQSFARPGGMVTGVTASAAGGEEALAGKRLSLMKELVPGLRRFASIMVAENPSFGEVQTGTTEAASRLGVEVFFLPVRTLDDVEAAFTSGVRGGADAFYVDDQPLMFSNRAKIADFAARAGKPTLTTTPQMARAGLLMSYGNDLVSGWRLYGEYAAKIMAGAKPGDLPIQQQSKFVLVINLKTAKTIGLAIPPTLLARADEVIE